MKQLLPKVLIVSRDVWDDSTASTLNNLFEDYEPNRLAHIYIETKKPNTSHCTSFFQISEYSLIRKFFNPRIKTGQKVDSLYVENKSIAEKEAATMNFVRQNRRYIFTILRELLWLFNGWKTKELHEYIKDENPDVIWFMGSPLVLMNRLMRHVVKVSKKPYCIFEMDDVYAYKIYGLKLIKRLYRFFLKRNVKHLMGGVSQLFVISPKMKKEYDEAFHLNSIVLTKGIDFSSVFYQPYQPHTPIRMVYMGNIIYDRISSLEMIGRVIDGINAVDKLIILSIYTKNPIDSITKNNMIRNGNVFFYDPVSYTELKNVINQNDVVVFVESLDKKFKRLARLSFSTKITDYLASGKCILALGPSDIAPIEYLRDNDAALIASNSNELRETLLKMLDTGIVEAYSKKAFSCGEKNHNKTIINRIVFNKLIEVSNYNDEIRKNKSTSFS